MGVTHGARFAPVARLPHEDGLRAGRLLLQPGGELRQRVRHSLVAVLQHAQQQADADRAGCVGVRAAFRVHGPAVEGAGSGHLGHGCLSYTVVVA